MSSIDCVGIISKVKLPAFAAVQINQAEFCSSGPKTSIQVFGSGSSSLFPPPFKLFTE